MIKYKLTDNTIETSGATLCQIQAVRDFGKVKAGDLGGYIQKDDNLSHEGNRNTGCFNTGCFNAGYFNAGDFNTGDFNTGDFNTGNFNIGDFSTGFLCTEQPLLMIFDKPVLGMTRNEFVNSLGYDVLRKLWGENVLGILWKDMSKAERKEHPEAKTTGLYLKKQDQKNPLKWYGLH